MQDMIEKRVECVRSLQNLNLSPRACLRYTPTCTVVILAAFARSVLCFIVCVFTLA